MTGISSLKMDAPPNVLENLNLIAIFYLKIESLIAFQYVATDSKLLLSSVMTVISMEKKNAIKTVQSQPEAGNVQGEA